EQNEVPNGTPSLPIQTASHIKQLTATISNAMKTKAALSPKVRMQRAIGAAGAAIKAPGQSLAQGFNTVRAGWLAMKNVLIRPWKPGGFMDAIKDWQFADQRASHETRKFLHKLNSVVRDPTTREGITNYIQADGDMALLAQHAAASKLEHRAGYIAAQNLTAVVRDPTTREGITNYIQADGDMALLAQHAAASKLEHRAGYIAAQNLNPAR